MQKTHPYFVSQPSSMNMSCFIKERGSNDGAWESAISLSHVTSSESKLRSASYKLPPLLLVGFKDVQFMFSLKKTYHHLYIKTQRVIFEHVWIH